VWLRIHDGLPFDPKVMLLGRTKPEVNEAIGMATRLWAWCAQQRTDGFIPSAIVDAIGTPATLRRLTRPVFDRRPFLHRRGEGDDCACLKSRPWPAGADFLVHDFLDRNPSRDENDVRRAKSREMKDPALKVIVRVRDDDRCRYCGATVNWADHRSARGGTYDHVDPDLANGAANLVVACRGCNARKKDRTPEQAGMRLLPLPGHPHHPTRDGPRSEPGSDPNPNPDPTRERTTDPTTGPDVGPAPPPRGFDAPDGARTTPAAAPETDTPDRTRGAVTSGTGRDGQGGGSAGGSAGYAGPAGVRPTVGPAATPRGQLDPNPYRKPRPDPDHHAGLPEPEAVLTAQPLEGR
jgi:hypothetical protein